MRIPERSSLRLLHVLIALTCGLFGGSSHPLLAQDQHIFQMLHTAWTARDGAPQNINTLAQTADGTLWLGTRDGLYSFDGLAFSLFQAVSDSVARRNVQSLFATNDGDLWALGQRKGATRIRDGRATVFDRVDQGTLVSLGYIQQSSDKTIWAILNQKNLVRLGTDGVWRLAAGFTRDTEQVGSFFIDSSDTQWIVANNVLYRRSESRTEFKSTEIPVFGPAKFEEANDHSIWIAGYSPMGVRPKQPAGQPPEFGLKHVDALGKRLLNPLTEDDASDIAESSDGTLWVSHTQSGLQRLRMWEMNGTLSRHSSDPTDAFGISDGLVTTGFRVLLRDRDGNIWSAGGRGLERFQPATMLAALPQAINGNWSVCVGSGGDVWLSLYDGFFAVIREHRLIRLKDQPATGSMVCSKDGSVRLLGHGIAEVRNDRVDILPLLPGRGNYYDNYKFTSVLSLQDGRLLASTAGATEDGLWTFRNRTWKPFLRSSGITRIQSLWEDAREYVYMGSLDGKITVLKPASFEVLSSETIGMGLIEGFTDTQYGVFAYGMNGIALQQTGMFHMLAFANPDLATRVSGLAEDRSGAIWINGMSAIARISSSEMKAAVSDRNHRILAREFREGEFRGSDNAGLSRNSIQLDPEGRIWLATANGVVFIDPQHTDRHLHIPHVSIRSISADGQPLGRKGSFPPKTQTVKVNYFGINLSNPAGVVYRYKLLGADTNWQDVGSRTEAIYTNPRPGTYTFQVMASNSGQNWSAPVESAPFTVLPTFYQTWWFASLCLAASGALLWLGLRVRIGYVAAAIRMRAEERATERVRIARELHDTLLQGVQGLLLTFHVAAEKVPDSHESKKSLEGALASADRLLLEGRDRVKGLRSAHLTSDEFEPLIAALASDLSRLSKIDFTTVCTGSRRQLNSDILEDLFFISREAIINSFHHSGASRVVFALDYGKSEFSIECRDDGGGFGKGALREAESNGHWGFRGMAERAEKIGANFAWESEASSGTWIRLVLSARRAYLPVRFGWRIFPSRKAERSGSA
jgi:signal transduction histidine kinase/ligand-binding sensor domain-containing protein